MSRNLGVWSVVFAPRTPRSAGNNPSYPIAMGDAQPRDPAQSSKVEYFEDYQIGESRETTGRTITEADVVFHAGQTGDLYSLHVDAEYAKTQPYGQRVAHGTLILAIAAGMATQLDRDSSPAVSYGYDRVRFVKPVFIGDTIHSQVRLVDKREDDKRPSHGMLHNEFKVFNQHGDVVLIFTHLLLADKRPINSRT
jgi:acyl dehydratase